MQVVMVATRCCCCFFFRASHLLSCGSCVPCTGLFCCNLLWPLLLLYPSLRLPCAWVDPSMNFTFYVVF